MKSTNGQTWRSGQKAKPPTPTTVDLGEAVVRQIQELLELRLDLDNQHAEQRALQPESTRPQPRTRSKLTVRGFVYTCGFYEERVVNGRGQC